MSGGHFDYGCFRISQFADELKHELEINNDLTKDEYGCQRGAGYSGATLKYLHIVHSLIEMAGKLAKEVEWLYSGDTGGQPFQNAVYNILTEGLKKTKEKLC